MRMLFVMLLLILVMIAAARFLYSPAMANDRDQQLQFKQLSEWRWQYRILIVRLDTKQAADEILGVLRESHDELLERKLQVLIVSHQKQIFILNSTGALEQNEQANTDKIIEKMAGKSSVLIGLDGGSKSFYDWPGEGVTINLKDVFADIDGMPMRQNELRQKKAY